VVTASPIRYGFDVVKRAPAAVLLEVAWRWTFGLVATVLLVLGARAFLRGLNLTAADEQALQGHDPATAAAALMHAFQQPNVWSHFLSIAFVVAVPSAVVWIAAATLGRAAVLRQLLGLDNVDHAPIFYLTSARVAALFTAFVLWFVWMFICAFISMRGEEPNYPLYFLLSLLGLPLIALGWGLVNWLLSFATMIAARDRLGALRSYGETLRLARQERRPLMSITSWLGIPRLVALIFLLIITVLVLIVVPSAIAAGLVLTVITLAYCAFADYLYVVRLAAYGQVADKRFTAQAN